MARILVTIRVSAGDDLGTALRAGYGESVVRSTHEVEWHGATSRNDFHYDDLEDALDLLKRHFDVEAVTK